MAGKFTHEQENRLRQLFEAYLIGELKAEDQEELIRGLESPEGESLLESVMVRDIDEAPSSDSLKVKAAIDRWLDARMTDKLPVRSLKRWKYSLAAAVVIALAGTFSYLLLVPHKAGNPVAQRYKNDLSPGRDKAVLKLSDGKIVELNEKAAGEIPNQDGVNIREENGWIRYEAGKDAHYNDLYTPVGAQIKVVLADGTRVWLDASSSIHFPTAFRSGNREVTITGQAYFEVVTNASQAFIVHAKDQTITVLGTHFNVNAYGSGAARVKTTLEQGSVMVSSGSSHLRLAPGQQADGMVLKTNADLEEILAWKNGEFRFNGASIEVIMEQMARWYGAEVVYKDEIKEEFVAKIPRNVPVSKVLKYLETTGQVQFIIEGNVITVMK